MPPVNQPSPLLAAHNASRYDRVSLITDYERSVGCRLVVMIDEIFNDSITLFEDLIYDADDGEDLHLMLDSPGGDGEAAVRLAKSILSRCRELTVIIPSQAKSAATLLALGAHHIVMTPFSDLGPVDAQLWDISGENLVAAKDIIATMNDTIQRVQENPSLAPLYQTLLSDLTATQVQEARSALGRSYKLLELALMSNPNRKFDEDATRLRETLRELLIDLPESHAALFSSNMAMAAGLPVVEADLKSEEWRILWRLWAMYFALGPSRIYEGRDTSIVLARSPESD